jgi:hypothetical protein
MTINTKYFDNIITSIEKIPELEEKGCEELNKIMVEVEEYCQKQLQKLLEELLSLQVLSSIPHDLAGVIQWITNVVAKIAGPVAVITADYAQLAAKYTELMVAINNAVSGLHCDFDVNISPTIPSIP